MKSKNNQKEAELVKQKSSGDQSPTISSEGNVDANIHSIKAQNYFNITLSKQDYNDDLIALQKDKIKQLQSLSEDEKEKRAELKKEIYILKNKLLNIEENYQQEMENLKARLKEFETLKATLPKGQFEQAKQALLQGKNQRADNILIAIEQQQAKYVAQAAHLRGEIAKGKVNFREAKQHYLRAYEYDSKNSLYANEVGFMCETLGEYNEALFYYKKTLDLNLNQKQKDFEKIAIDYNNLGKVYTYTYKFSKAHKNLKKAYELDKNNFGLSHPKVARRLSNIGNLYSDEYKYNNAYIKHQEALSVTENFFSDDEHPDIIRDKNNLALSLYYLGKSGEAKLIFEELLDISDTATKAKGYRFSNIINNLGLCLLDLGDINEAIIKFKQAIELDEDNFGEIHPNVARTYRNLVLALIEKEKNEEAREYAEKALSIDLEIFGKKHLKIAHSFIVIARVHKAFVEYDEAFQVLKKALKLIKKSKNGENPLVASISNLFGDLYAGKKDLEQAKNNYKRALKMLSEVLGVNHPKTEKLREKLYKLD